MWFGFCTAFQLRADARILKRFCGVFTICAHWYPPPPPARAPLGPASPHGSLKTIHQKKSKCFQQSQSQLKWASDKQLGNQVREHTAVSVLFGQRWWWWWWWWWNISLALWAGDLFYNVRLKCLKLPVDCRAENIFLKKVSKHVFCPHNLSLRNSVQFIALVPGPPFPHPVTLLSPPPPPLLDLSLTWIGATCTF